MTGSKAPEWLHRSVAIRIGQGAPIIGGVKIMILDAAALVRRPSWKPITRGRKIYVGRGRPAFT